MAGILICLSSPLQLSDVRSSLHGSVRTAGFCLLSHCMSATCSISPLSFILEHLTVEILSPGKQTCEHWDMTKIRNSMSFTKKTLVPFHFYTNFFNIFELKVAGIPMYTTNLLAN